MAKPIWWRKSVLAPVVAIVLTVVPLIWWRKSLTTDFYAQSFERFHDLPALSDQPNAELQAVRYSNTHASYDDGYQTLLDPRKAKYLHDGWIAKIEIPAFPTNDSPRTKAELEYLVALKMRRNPTSLARIMREDSFAGVRFGNVEIKLSAKPTDSRATALSKYLSAAIQDIAIGVFYFKRRFDRPRPDKLDARVEPVIPMPPHEAYPSGHSTQAFTFAYLLAKFAPERAKEFERAAFEVVPSQSKRNAA